MKLTSAVVVAFLAVCESALAGGIEGEPHLFIRKDQPAKTVTVHDVSTSVTTATVTVTLGANGSPARVASTPAPTKNTSVKISGVNTAPPPQKQGVTVVPPPKIASVTPKKQAATTAAPPKKQGATTTPPPKKQGAATKAPPQKQGKDNKKTTTKKVVKTTTSLATRTLAPGTYTTTRTSAKEKTVTALVTTAAPVVTTELATVTVTEAVPVTTTVAGKPVTKKVVKTKTKVQKVTKTKTAVVTQTAVVTSTDLKTLVVTQTFDKPTTVVLTETVKQTETLKFTETDTATATATVTDTVKDNGTADAAATAVTDSASTSLVVLDASSTTAAAATDSTSINVLDASSTASDTSSAAPPANTEDPQESLTLDPRVIQPNLALDGQQVPTAGQVPSLTSKNNFINFCLTQDIPLTDGKQVRSGSCNVVPMGRIIPKANLPSAKFVFPVNFSTLKANQAFTIQLKVNNMQLGFFTNAQLNYYAAPAQVNDAGIVIGHTHVVIETLTALDQTEPANPLAFAFFKGVNIPPNNNGVVTADVSKGLPAGTYRLFSINTASNHQPVLASVAQHGSMDDGIYFTVV